MIAALASGDLGRIILAYRSHPLHGRRPLSQAVVADWLHVSQTSLSRIEHGRCRLSFDDIAGFSRALGLSVALRWTPLPQAGEDVDPLSRRSLFGAGAGIAGLGATTTPTAAREIDPELVSHWMKLLRVLGRHDAMFGSHDVLAAVRRELELIADHRQRARADLRTRLLHVESRWAEFAGWLSDDVGDAAMYDYWTARALRLAHESGYQDMVAWVLMNESREAAARDDARRAVALADAALRTPGTSDQSRALSMIRVAHGHAVANDAASFQRTFDAAQRLLDALPQRREDLGAEYVNPGVRRGRRSAVLAAAPTA